MKLKEITDCIEKVAPLAFQEDYDNSGLTIGNPEMEIDKVLITLDVTEAVMDEATEKGCDLVISHHPVIFKGLKSLTGVHYSERITMIAIKNGIALYATHTSLDNASGGLNKYLITKMGVKNTVVLTPGKGMLCKLVTFCPVDFTDRVRQALFEAGAGKMGTMIPAAIISGVRVRWGTGKCKPLCRGNEQTPVKTKPGSKSSIPLTWNLRSLKRFRTSSPYQGKLRMISIR